jgi:hypothetical protein
MIRIDESWWAAAVYGRGRGMIEAVSCEVVTAVVPLDAVWQAGACAVPLRRRGTIDDPLTPFILWIQVEHRLGEDQALQIAQGLRRLLGLFSVDEVLTEDPISIADRAPFVQTRMYVCGKRSAHAKRPRRCVRLFQEWAAVRGSI